MLGKGPVTGVSAEMAAGKRAGRKATKARWEASVNTGNVAIWIPLVVSAISVDLGSVREGRGEMGSREEEMGMGTAVGERIGKRSWGEGGEQG